jgi:hypothetical protein
MEMGAITPMEVLTERLVMAMTIVTTGIKTMGMGMGLQVELVQHL